ncbi:molybdopterin-guanine dinucleotide biosynthesis protein B [Bacillus sp. P14.5]|uniref:molybdopterin-guanine dinucleotide biosynthesis protein B n=1 Tax=Bacillus sp. P14.5 TaxID=1983400 RepID=UPI000DE883AB|nr:molybdopterin-guanine dinucleotide biosynthesis protein B [Bacillus sp. P14.5]
MNIIQVVGYKKSGKTTLSSKLIKISSEKGYQVGSCKHHGHGTPDVLPGTDSARHQKAGALISGVEGGGTLNLSILNKKWTLEKILEFYRLIELDLIIVEGFKQETFPKIVLVRRDEDLHLTADLENVIAVVGENISKLKTEKGVRNFQSFHQEDFETWFIDYLNLIKR